MRTRNTELSIDANNQTLLDAFIGKKVDMTIDFYSRNTILKATIMGYWKPFFFIKVNGYVRALNEAVVKEIFFHERAEILKEKAKNLASGYIWVSEYSGAVAI